MTWPVSESVAGFKDLSRRELAAVVPLLALILVLGFAPGILTKYINPAVQLTPQTSTTHSITTPPHTAADAALAAGSQK
jgi:NADH-quinone oxidoreductase subunit M